MAIAIHQCSKTRQLSSIARSEDEDDLLPLEDVLRPTANGTTIGPRRAGVESDHVYNSEQVKKASSRHTQRKPRPKFRYPPGWQSSDKVKSRLSQTSQSDLHIGSSCGKCLGATLRLVLMCTETPISMLNDRKHESDGDSEKEEDAAERNQRNRWVTLHTPEVQETQDAENIQQEATADKAGAAKDTAEITEGTAKAT